MGGGALVVVTFESFAAGSGPKIRAGLVASFGSDVGGDAAAEALAYGWEHWDRVGVMRNPVGYLFRVGQNAAKGTKRPAAFLAVPPPVEIPDFEPGLIPALEALTESQRVSVMLVHAFGWTQAEAAEVLDVSPSTVRTHLARGLAKLQAAFEVQPHV